MRPQDLTTRFTRAGPGLIILVLTLNGCGPSAPWAPAAASSTDQAADAGDDGGYQAPPRLIKGNRLSAGRVSLSGLGAAGAAVRLSSPNGAAQETQANASGEWSMTVAVRGPAIYGLSQVVDGRRDQAQGYVLVLPGTGLAAAELRSGAGARTLPPDAPGGPRVDAVDVDDSGAAIVSGWAGAGQAVHVTIDGAPVDEGAAGPAGRFSLALPKPLAAGPHTVQVASQAGSAQADLEVMAAAPFSGPLHALARGAGWRVDWQTPAGGVQTTFLFAADKAKP